MNGLRHRFVALLRWSERYTKTDMIYLTKGSFWIALGQAIYIPTALILSIAFANLVPKDVFGTYRFVLSVGTIIGAFAFTGIDTAIPQAVARGYEGMLRYGFKTYLKWSWLMIAAAGVVAAYYIVNGNLVLAACVLIVGITTPPFLGASLYGEFLSGRKNFMLSSLLGSGQLVFNVLVMLVTMLLTHNVVALILAYFGSNLVSALALYYYVLRRFKPNTQLDPESVRFGQHTSVVNIIGTIADNLDKLLVFHFLGAAELAAYSFATSLPDYLRSSAKFVGTLATPKFAEQGGSLGGTVPEKTARLGLFLAVVAVAYAIAAPYIFHLFYPLYAESILYSQVYALVILTGAVNIPVAAIYARRGVREQYTIAFIDNVVMIILLIAFSMMFGVWGVIAARLIGRYLTLIISSALARNF